MFGSDQFHKRVAGDGASATDRPTAKYVGVRTDAGVTVAREDDRGGIHPLAARTDLKNHSPSGFEWGYGGSGPAQFALAVLADAMGAELALACCQKFKFRVVAKLARESWELSRDEVVAWYREFSAESDVQPEGSGTEHGCLVAMVKLHS